MSSENDKSKNSDKKETAAEAMMATLLAAQNSSAPNAAELQKIMQALSMSTKAPTSAGAIPDAHKFWDTQPVPKMSAKISEHGPFETKTVADVRAEPYPLVKGFTWETMDLSDPAAMTDLYVLLTENYVEDDSATFRFDYSRDFLNWALTPPGFLPQWHLGVRTADAHKRLCAFISAVPARTRAYEKEFPAVEINFLCVHKSLRSKRLAPVLIKEITRRVNLQDIWQASYTAGIVIPKPVGSCQYFHRSLDIQKLCQVGFTRLPSQVSMTLARRMYAVPATPALPGVRPMEPRDVPRVTVLLNAALAARKLVQVFSEEETAHWLLPRAGVISSYVVCNGKAAAKKDGDDAEKAEKAEKADAAESAEEGKGDEVTDFFSFYSLPSTISGNPKHNLLKAAYQYYHAATTVALKDLMTDALHFAHKEGFDVFNALTLMDNKSFLEELKFKAGDGYLQYYLYNWQCPTMETEDVGLILL